MKRLTLALVSLAALAGCQNAQTTSITLDALERGNARGELMLTTGGAVSAGMRQTFFLGADESALSFHGSVDFSRPPGARAEGDGE